MKSRHHRAALWTTLVAVPAATIGCQAALTERNPASHAIWWVSGALFLLLLLILAVEGLDWLRSRWRRLRGLDPPPDASPGRTESDLDPNADRRRARSRARG